MTMKNHETQVKTQENGKTGGNCLVPGYPIFGTSFQKSPFTTSSPPCHTKVTFIWDTRPLPHATHRKVTNIELDKIIQIWHII